MINEVCERVLFSEEEIRERCEVLGKQIDKDYAGKQLLIVGLLKGSVPFMAELIKHISIDVEIDFMTVASYEGTKSTGEIKIVKDLDHSVEGKTILICEDIVDTGRTLVTVKELLLSKGAEDVKIVTLLDKKARRVVEIDAEYVGFEIENEFVIGYGLDYDQKYRNFPYIGVLKREVYEK